MNEQMLPVEEDTVKVVVVPPPVPSAPEAVSEPWLPPFEIRAEPREIVGVPPALAPAGPVARGAPVDGTRPAVVGRQLRRKVRRERRRIAVLCGLVVFACLAITVFILGMARDRPARTSSFGTNGAVVHSAAFDSSPLSLVSLVQQKSLISGALAPIGGHP